MLPVLRPMREAPEYRGNSYSWISTCQSCPGFRVPPQCRSPSVSRHPWCHGHDASASCATMFHRLTTRLGDKLPGLLMLGRRSGTELSGRCLVVGTEQAQASRDICADVLQMVGSSLPRTWSPKPGSQKHAFSVFWALLNVLGHYSRAGQPDKNVIFKTSFHAGC